MVAKLIEDGKVKFVLKSMGNTYLTMIFKLLYTKCEQYWPDIGKKKRYGDIIVFNAKHAVFADFTFRTLHVTYGDEARKVRNKIDID